MTSQSPRNERRQKGPAGPECSCTGPPAARSVQSELGRGGCRSPGALELLSATAAASAAGRLRNVLIFHIFGTVVLGLRDVGVGMRHDAGETL